MVATVLTDLVQVLNPRNKRKTIREWAKIAPLLAALIAPITSLLDIPALTQNWYTKNNVPQKDFTASLVLSAVGLAFNLTANALLVARFSAEGKYWHLATQMSLGCWIVKTILAVSNLVVFGIFSRNGDGFHYEEGFWCAVVSVIGSGIISLLLLFHYIFDGNFTSDEESKKIRISGRHFMLSIISLISLLAIEALIFSKIEDWQYLDGIYYSVVSMLTIGFGDFEPTKTATRILLFPFAILTIAQLANQVGMIIEFFSQRSESRKSEWRLRYEALQDAEDEAQTKHDKHNPDGDLKKEVEWLMAQSRREQNLSELYDLAWSLATLLLFWLVGALVFSHLEGWTYGDGVYFCYVIFLAIGYGDFVPGTPAGKVIFIIYSLMAVPVVASFAVQTVTRILETFSERRLLRREEMELTNRKSDKDRYLSHAELCLKQHQTLSREDDERSQRERKDSNAKPGHEKQRENDEREEKGRDQVRKASGDKEGKADSTASLVRRQSGSSTTSSLPSPDIDSEETGPDTVDPAELPTVDEKNSRSRSRAVSHASAQAEVAEQQALQDIDKLLVKRVLQLSVELETQARVLLMHALPKGSDAEVLLRADMVCTHFFLRVRRQELIVDDSQRLQHREVKKLGLEDPDAKLTPEGLVDITEPESGDIDVEDRIQRYRELFAALLATGSKLQRLEGMEQLVWERRTKRERQIAEEDAEPHPESRGRLKEEHDQENRADDKKQQQQARDMVDGDPSNNV
ncbi:hypothetical protein HWV62_21228 [Athelia sp. TMB]|nr:hypothetical protein HWV62_21228 [Athelia sp. TMB]